MRRLRTWLALPKGGDPRETLLWVRRVEIVIGLLGLVGGAVGWSGAWWSWLIVGGSLLTLSPWPGAGAILRKPERRPGILITDPERRRERRRRATRYLLPTYVVVFTVVGYLLLGVGGAIFFFVMAVAGGGLGAWLAARLEL